MFDNAPKAKKSAEIDKMFFRVFNLVNCTNRRLEVCFPLKIPWVLTVVFEISAEKRLSFEAV